MVAVKTSIILVFIVLAVGHVESARWHPFLPHGMAGVTRSAAVVFNAYIGFDAVATTAEEAVDPRRDLPIGIVGSLGVATLLYVVVAAIMTGVVPWSQLDVADPIARVLDALRMPWASALVSVGAVAGITSTLLVILYAQPRTLLAMSRDGLLPPIFSRVHARFRTPHVGTMACAAIVSVGAGLLPIQIVAEMASIGTLFAFGIVCGGVLVLRRTRPDLRRPFSAPLFPVLPAAGIALCAYLMASLAATTWIRFGVWLVVGLTIYAAYGHRRSKVAAATSG